MIFTQEKAREVAKILNDDVDDDCTYMVIDNPDPDGLKNAIIRVYDEEGVFIALV